LNQKLVFNVPEPTGRPGDEPDFSEMDISHAGEARRPKITSDARDMKDMARTMVRVLNRDGKAVGPWAEQELSPATLLEALRNILRTRAYDHRMLQLQRQGKTSFYIQSTGEEAISIGFQLTMNKGDMAFTTYRMQGMLIASGYSIVDMASQILSNANDPLKGRQIPVAYSARKHGVFSISANLGTQYPQAVGWAMASAISGDTKIASAWIGDGSTAENDFHSGLVFASVYKPPVILNITNNQWAISSFRGIAGGDTATFAERAHGYDIPSLRVDGNDILAVYAASKWATERAHANLGPTLIEWVTYRVGAHSTSDDPKKYRPVDESDSWPLGDPMMRLKVHLIEIGSWSEERHQQAEAEVDSEVRTAVKEAESYGVFGAGSKISDMFDDVYKELPPHLIKQREQAER
jgi:2-oxoisovalerate dehydrogenase E1 component alpha subunit